MTDEQIIRLCAEAMGYGLSEHQCIGPALWLDRETRNATGYGDYDPLHDDAQAMALVKKFPWECIKAIDMELGETRPDINRAICLCVAKMQSERSHHQN
ncbi:MAG: hypothetical protein EBV45_12540 [Chloroflexi bacterium]|nr:hypothetical protein [Chloroflexota bacterium]